MLDVSGLSVNQGSIQMCSVLSALKTDMRHVLLMVLVMLVSSPLVTAARAEPPTTRPASTIHTDPLWKVTDDGQFIDVEGAVLRARFAYGGKGSEGWFKGGGGQDFSIVELYYKPTS